MNNRDLNVNDFTNLLLHDIFVCELANLLCILSLLYIFFTYYYILLCHNWNIKVPSILKINRNETKCVKYNFGYWEGNNNEIR